MSSAPRVTTRSPSPRPALITSRVASKGSVRRCDRIGAIRRRCRRELVIADCDRELGIRDRLVGGEAVEIDAEPAGPHDADEFVGVRLRRDPRVRRGDRRRRRGIVMTLMGEGRRGECQEPQADEHGLKPAQGAERTGEHWENPGT
jgi:hypothetical protein